MSKVLIFFWSLIAIAVFIYSYGFVDLNLTLSSNPVVFNFVSWVQGLVYFDRQTSLIVFIGLILLMFLVYVGGVVYWSKKSFPWRLVTCIAIIFALSYPMLSSDVFKYLFAAKEILVYHANPYTVTPDTFAEDTWIRFMRWVHTTTPYGPVFVGLTIPYYLLGMGKFVPILYLFKIDQIAWYLLSIWLIGKLSKSTKAQLFFALNPLILMEWLVNAHNDAIMIALLLLSLYFFTLKQKAWSFVTLLFSIGIKYITIVFLPIILLSKSLKLTPIVYYLIFVLALAPILYHYSWQYQPWYVTWLIPLAALIPNRTLRWTVGVYSFSVFSRYLYFVGTGSWLGTLSQHTLMTFALPVLTLLVFGLAELKSRLTKSVRAS